MPDTLLRVDRLSKRFHVRAGLGRHAGVVEAVHDLSFDLEQGGSLAIVGESGSGKTTTARIIVGLEIATAGVVTLAGNVLAPTSAAKERRRRAQLAQIVFQNPFSSLDPRQTAQEAVEELLGFHLGLRGARRATRALEILSDVGVAEREAKRKPRQLSGGQCQRVAIARALAVEPKLLVLDEAVSALDVSVQAQILNLLADLREQRDIALLFITHDLAVVNQIAERVLVMYRGRVVEEGTTERVLTFPAHPYTRKLLDSAPEPDAPIPTPSPAFDDVDDGCRFRARCPYAFESCVDEPMLLQVSLGHTSRCWLASDDRASRSADSLQVN